MKFEIIALRPKLRKFYIRNFFLEPNRVFAIVNTTTLTSLCKLHLKYRRSRLLDVNHHEACYGEEVFLVDVFV
jgi:hypothetical protein